MRELLLQLTDEQDELLNQGKPVALTVIPKRITGEQVRPQLLVFIAPSEEQPCQTSS